MITRRAFLQLLGLLGLRWPAVHRDVGGLAYPLYFPDGLGGNGEKRVFIPGIK